MKKKENKNKRKKKEKRKEKKAKNKKREDCFNSLAVCSPSTPAFGVPGVPANL